MRGIRLSPWVASLALATAAVAPNCSPPSDAPVASGSVGPGGSAGGCALGLVECGATCVDTSSDVAHCGGCSQACAPGEVCSQGACASSCASGLTECGGSCVDPNESAVHCGQCGNTCQAGEACAAGICVATETTVASSSNGGASATTIGSGAASSNTSAMGGANAGGNAGSSAGGASMAMGGASNGGSGGGTGSGGLGGMGGAGNPEDVVAFPGAEGFGRDALGGRGGSVCHVTNLDDSGSGSLRDCVSESGVTVVFDVGGWITLDSNLGVTQDRITIAGQTAPGDGIGIRGRKFSIGGEHIVARYLRVRRGIGTTTDRDDAMTVSSDAANVIIDHFSVSYGTDETLSMPGDEGRGPRNLTLQWSIVAWGLQRNNHSAGALFTSNQSTIHHTLWAFNKTRNPRARSEESGNRGQGGHLDWVNNVIYGWNAQDPVGESEGWSLSYDPFILAGTSNGQHAANAVGNYFISRRSANYAFHNGTSNFSLFFENNLLDGNADGVLNTSKSGTDMVEGSPTMLGSRLDGPPVTTDTAEVAYQRVMADVGATFPARDEADTLLVELVESQSGILIQDETDLGISDSGYGTLENASRPTDFDVDRDGMADSWESENGLNPADPDDRNGDADGDGYTNLEEYLNALVR